MINRAEQQKVEQWIDRTVEQYNEQQSKRMRARTIKQQILAGR